MRPQFRILLPLLFLLTGCATDHSRFRVSSDWIRKSPEGTSFVLVQPVRSPVRHFDFDQKFDIYGAYLKAALQDRGFVEAESPATADLAIELYYTSGSSTTQTPARYPGVPSLEYGRKYVYIGIAAFDMETYTPAARWDPEWHAQIQAPGQWEEMDQKVPVMIAALMPFIGKSANRWINVYLEENENGEQVVRILEPE